MNDNEKLFELMTKMYSDMQEGFSKVNSRIDNLENEVKDFREETNTRFDNLDDKLDDIESNNADRHITINGEIKRIKAGLSKIEIVTADNWGDIARLKARKKTK